MNKKDDNIIICRCEEITLGEIKQTIREGARDVTGIKRRTRAGMGLCQGRTCEKLIQQVIKEELGKKVEEIGTSTFRPPVRPVTFGTLGGK
jgi:NAD(P)H-nitrite reductase large subunit